ncbi:MAG: hypothetical protein HKL84_10750 [Acidimicrobiaceae bacterium]|nr:hypothetical protein [Acidimicrobiaceae bacterium]
MRTLDTLNLVDAGADLVRYHGAVPCPVTAGVSACVSATTRSAAYVPTGTIHVGEASQQTIKVFRMKRYYQRQTQAFEVPHLHMISSVSTPAVDRSMILALQTSFCEPLRFRTCACRQR